MTSFTYHPLDGSQNTIRLLRLQPSRNRTASITCDLVNVSLDQEPQYEALYYTAGSPALSESITLCSCAFGVTANLKAALLALRQAEGTRYLWVDTICINQEDLQEKTREDSRVLEVYDGAVRVLVWVAPRHRPRPMMAGGGAPLGGAGA